MPDEVEGEVRKDWLCQEQPVLLLMITDYENVYNEW
jgi:hypothetical protein